MLINFIKQSWLVILAALVFGLLVAGVNGALQPRIKQNADAKLNSMLQLLLDQAESFESVAEEGQAPYYVGKNAAGETVGYALQYSGGGFADKIGLLIAFDESISELRGIAVLKSNETPGFGDKIKDETKPGGPLSFKDQFVNCPIANRLVTQKTGNPDIADETIVAISGATITSEAVVKIVNDAIVEMRAAVGQ